MSLESYVADSRMRHDSIKLSVCDTRHQREPTSSTAIHRFRLNLMRQNNFRIFKERSSSRRELVREATHAPHAMHVSPHAHPLKTWWSQPGSNRRPPACKAGALPAELWPLIAATSIWQDWWVWEDLNLRPHPYQGCALTN